MIPTVENFMAKLAANKTEGIAFDNCRPDLTRRQHCQLILSQVENSCGHIADSKRLRDARATNAQLKNEVAIAKNRLKFLTPESTVRHNLHAAPCKKLPVGPAKSAASINPTKAIAPAAPSSINSSAPTTGRRYMKPIPTQAAKSTLSSTGLAKVSNFFAAQARK